MATWKEGDRVRVIRRAVTEEDRRKSRYFEHMADLTGTVQQAYAPDEIAVKVDSESMTPVTADVVRTATQRMREKFVANVSEEQRKQLSKEELEFNANYVLLVRSVDLEAA
ncbi:MAG: hypothetical protein ACO1SV_11700 [Fimbriimonas sp.]